MTTVSEKDKKTKKRKAFYLPEETIEKVKKDAEILGVSMNEVLKIAINTFNAYTKIKRKFRESPIKYGDTDKKLIEFRKKEREGEIK